MTAALPAFLLESFCYLGSIFEGTREWFARIFSAAAQAAILWMTALLPYVIFSLQTETLHRNAFYLLAMLCAVLSFWYVLLPRRIAYDAGFLAVAAAPLVLHVFQRIYRAPEQDLRIDALGHLMWIRLGAVALLNFRNWDPGAFGFWPEPREWRVGMRWYLLAIVPTALLALSLHDVQFAPVPGNWWRIVVMGSGTFFGILWVVALGEELFFRGVVARALLNLSNSRLMAVLVSALLFGAVHLWFREFPNWRRALVATVLGVACGIAYVQTDSVRAPMVTHAFVVATWRMFFR